jgi:hypothetical protein
MGTICTRRLNLKVPRLLSLFLVLAIVLTACNSGMPSTEGEFQLQPDSLTWDGHQYRFAWVDQDGSVRWAQGDDVKLVEDARTYLEMRDGKPTVHLTSDTPVTVLARDRGGDFSTFWLPFAVGTMLGRQTPNDQPAYRYPPTDSIGRGDTLRGSTVTSRPTTSGYRGTSPVGDAVSGQSGGAGSGSAASSKGTGAVSGQAGGTGAGSAASSKGTSSGSGISGARSSGGLSGAKSSGGLKGRK